MNTKCMNISDVYGKYSFIFGGGGGEGVVLEMCDLNYIIKSRSFVSAVIMELYCSRMSSRAFSQCRQVSLAVYIRKFEHLLIRNSKTQYFRIPLGPANLVVQNPGRDRSQSVGWPGNSTPCIEAYLQQPANDSYCTIHESSKHPVFVYEIGFNIIFTFVSMSSKRSVHMRLSD